MANESSHQNRAALLPFCDLKILVYLHEDGLCLATVFSSSFFTMGGEEDLIGWDACISHALLSSQHPDNDIRHAVLRLWTKKEMLLCVCTYY